MDRPERIAVYGGTFSPPHVGHVRAARAFLEAVHPDRLLIIPDYLPPHKNIDGGASASDRYEMCRLAFGDLPGTEISDMEIRRAGKSYTSDTLTVLTRPGREIFLLCGTDMFLTLNEWHDPQTVFALCTPCVVRRESDAAAQVRIERAMADYSERYGKRGIAIPSDVIEISSSDLRDLLANDKENAKNYLPNQVFNYILKKRLYSV